jgi:chromosome partitioning protein
MQIITVAASKGGAGKTTTAINLAAGLSNFMPTMLIDFDPSGQASLYLGLSVDNGVARWLGGSTTLAKACQVREFHNGELPVLAGDSSTKGIQEKARDRATAEKYKAMLRGIITGAVVIDTAGGGVLQELAMSVADQVVIPFRPEVGGTDGVFITLRQLEQINPAASITLLPVAYNRRWNEHKINLKMMQDKTSPDYGLSEEMAISARIGVAEANAEGLTVWEFKGYGAGELRSAFSLLVGRVMSLMGVEAYDGEEN